MNQIFQKNCRRRQTSTAVMELFKKYHKGTGVTIVLVAHDDEIAKYGSRSLYIEDGRLRDFGK